jgi:serpin B
MSRSLPRAAALLLVLGGALNVRPGAADEKPVDARAAALAQGQNAFAVDLYARLKDTPGNVLFSAYSIQTALAMTRAGAKGETAAQMDRVLHLPAAAAPEAWRALVRSVTTAPAVREWQQGGKEAETPAYAVAVANALFGQKGYPFEAEFRRQVTESYGAELRDVDFRLGPAVRKEINDWVLSKTNDKIKDLIPEGMPTADTRLALVNAIHFLAQWAEPFQERATEDAKFTDAKGEQVNVRMMHRTDHYRYRAEEDVQVLAIPYRGNATEMIVVLPKTADGLAALEKGLTVERVQGWAGGSHAKVALSLPRFRFEAPTDLSEPLKALGMRDAFDVGKADFTGMANVPGEPLYIGIVLHKAFIAVDEKGTEAAAATAVMMRAGSAPRPEPPIPFVCDRPFLFFLRHVPTGALLFAGRLSMPG